jgi:SAM-dependent methyltransferase
MASAIQPHNERAAATWGAGGAAYDAISRTIADSIEHCLQRLAPGPGERVLDLATGTGWAARGAAARGAEVVGVDIGADLIEAAKERARQAGLEIAFEVGDAERLRFEDESFEVVVSTCGVMFASDPEAAAAEIARVCKRGGRVGLTTWPPEGTLSGSCSGQPSTSSSRPARPCCASPTARRSGASSRPATARPRPSRASSTPSAESSCAAISSRSTTSSAASSGWPCRASTC